MTKRLIWLLSSILLAGLATGCSGDKDKGINRGKDIPVPADTAAKEPR